MGGLLLFLDHCMTVSYARARFHFYILVIAVYAGCIRQAYQNGLYSSAPLYFIGICITAASSSPINAHARRLRAAAVLDLHQHPCRLPRRRSLLRLRTGLLHHHRDLARLHALNNVQPATGICAREFARCSLIAVPAAADWHRRPCQIFLLPTLFWLALLSTCSRIRTLIVQVLCAAAAAAAAIDHSE